MKAADLDILLQEGEGVMLEYKESACVTRHGLSVAPRRSSRRTDFSPLFFYPNYCGR